MDENGNKNPFADLRGIRTDPKVIKLRKGKGGKSFKYINRATALLYLDLYMDKWLWNFDLKSVQLIRDQYVGAGTLMVWYKGARKDVTCVGSADIKSKTNEETGAIEELELDYIKTVETDALKRCCACVGLFHDVYSELEIDDLVLNDTVNPEMEEFYINNILPLTIKKLEPKFLYSQIKMLLNNEINKDDLNELYNTLKDKQ